MNEFDRKNKAREIFQSLQSTMQYLAGRWEDEKRYEDIRQYADVINNALKPFDITVSAMVKRPFGFTYQIADVTYRVTCSMREYAYRRLI